MSVFKQYIIKGFEIFLSKYEPYRSLHITDCSWAPRSSHETQDFTPRYSHTSRIWRMYELWDDRICHTFFSLSCRISLRPETPSSICCYCKSETWHTSLSYVNLCQTRTPHMVAGYICMRKYRETRYGEKLYTIQKSLQNPLLTYRGTHEKNICNRMGTPLWKSL